MIGTLLEKLFVAVGADLSGLNSELDQASKEVSKSTRDMKKHFESIGSSFKKTGAVMMVAGAGMTATVTAPLIAFGKQAATAATESREAMGQVEAALKSMGPVAGRTSDQLSALAEQLQKTSTFDDDEILKKVTANLLTFGNVSGEVFDRASKAAVDMSARLGQDLQSSAIQLGKALNDPKEGLSALSRVGVKFTDDQKAMIEKMQEAGDVAGAQAVMLKELERQFGGAAQAARDATPGADATDAWREFEETIGELVLNILPPLTNLLTGVLNAFNNLSPAVQTMVVGGAAFLAVLGPLVTGIGAVVTAVGFLIPLLSGLAPVLSAIGAAFMSMMLSPLGLIVIAVGAVVAAWYYWDEIVAVVQRVGKAISAWYSENVKPTVDAVMASIRPLVDFFVNFFGAQIEGVLKVISALLRGDFSGAWTAAKEMVTRMVMAVIKVVQSIAPGVISAMASMYNGVKTWIMDKLGGIFSWLQGKLKAVAGWFFDLYDAVVGHSYIPDMVDKIGENMAQLEKLMVAPAKKATDATKEAFRQLAGDVKGLLESLFPLQTELKSTLDQIALLDKGLKAKLIDPATYSAAFEQLAGKERKLRDEAGAVQTVTPEMDIPEINVLSTLPELIDTLPKLSEAFSQVQKDAMAFGEELGDTIMGGVRDFLTGRASLGDVLSNGLSKILDNAITSALKNIETGLFGEGGLGGFLGSLFSNIAGGARAVGGPTLPGKAYDVGLGEKFVPGQSGRVLSRSDAMKAVASQFGGGVRERQGDVHVHINGQMSDRDARRTGLQAGRAAKVALAHNSKVQPA